MGICCLIKLQKLHATKTNKRNAQSMMKQSNIFNFFGLEKERSSKNLPHDSASFLWSQLLLNVLKKLPRTELAKQEMLNKFIDYYKENEIEQKKIELFRLTYEARDAIKWFTADSFIYRLVNKALRNENIDDLYLYRFYIIDLCTQLEEESKQTKLTTSTLYRGQKMSEYELDKFQNHIGMIISTNGFLSSTQDRKVALTYVEGMGETDELKKVLFEITIDKDVNNVTYADVDRLSQMKGEKEVLFSTDAVFKIDNVVFDSDLKIWKIQMTISDEGSILCQPYITKKTLLN
ncbi:unnamed protein product [Didymodactylos carnosus]|uniref:ADP ribosyltransferase domain-containing protein n=1 Tax=Didymodactylos carnosus TaxID=1234261 RepID=A0A813Y465_9BILA|nr:unnamed protein product [Didymodactylos carnosus]CAF3662297.1 unnamed protein product [Didymodactylos carnosus]